MTYRELANELAQFSDEQLNQTVTVYIQGVDEYYGLVSDYPLTFSEADDILDKDHPYLVI